MIDVRARRTKRINRARVELEVSRSAKPAIIVALGLLLGAALLLFILVRVNPNTLRSTYQARFAVDDVTAVQAGINDVKIKGIPVGTIQKVDVEGDQPVLRVQIRSSYGRLYKDARAELRPNTALQDMFLDVVDRGTPAAGELGEDELLPSTQTKLPVNVPDVLNVFGPSQRLRMATLLDELGNGTKDRGRALRALFVQLTPFVQNAGTVSRQIAERRPQTRRLVHNTAVLTRELGRRQAALRTLVQDGGATLGTVQDGSQDLDATLRELPPTLTAIRSSFAATRGVLGDVDGALTALSPVADELPGSLAGLRGLAGDLRPAVGALRGPVGHLVPLAGTLRPLARDLDQAIGALAPQVDTVNKVTATAVACKRGIQGFFQWNASMSKFGDSRGPVPRGNLVLGAQSSGLINDPGEVAPQACAPGKVIGGRLPTEADKR